MLRCDAEKVGNILLLLDLPLFRAATCAFCYLVGAMSLRQKGPWNGIAITHTIIIGYGHMRHCFVAPFSCPLIWNKQRPGSALSWSWSCAERCEIQFRQFQAAIVTGPLSLSLATPSSPSHIAWPTVRLSCPFSLLRPFAMALWLLPRGQVRLVTDRLPATVWTSDTN